MVDVRTRTNHANHKDHADHTKPAAKREDPRAPLREERKRRLRLVAGAAPTIKVWPANDDMRRVLRHPGRGIRFRGLDQPVEWPNDSFTKRRIAEGAVRTDGPGDSGGQPEADESLNPRQQTAVRFVQDARPEDGERPPHAAHPIAPGGRPETTLRLVSLSPNNAIAGSEADIVMSCIGTGFTKDTVIKFGDYDEPTTFVSATEVTTGVKPSLFVNPDTVQVLVHTGEVSSEPLTFTFTAAGGMPKAAKAPHSPPKHD